MIQLEEAKMAYLDYTFNLTIETGKVYLIVGENGKGKSTLIRLMLGLIRPDSGKVVRKKFRIAYLPEVIQLPPFISAKAYLGEFSRMKRAILDENLIAAFEFPMDKSIHALSKGNKQKLGILITLLGDPKLVILDEPLTGLDARMKEVLIDALKEKKKKGCTLVIATHERGLYEGLCDHVISL